jgi:hypothetical protein
VVIPASRGPNPHATATGSSSGRRRRPGKRAREQQKRARHRALTASTGGASNRVLEPTGASAASDNDHTYAQPSTSTAGSTTAAASTHAVPVHDRHVVPLSVVSDPAVVSSVAVELSTSEFLAQPIVHTVADAQAAATPVIQIDGRRFCTACSSFTCDHASELDFEWTAEDDAALIAGDDEESDGYTSVPSSDEEALLAD